MRATARQTAQLRTERVRGLETALIELWSDHRKPAESTDARVARLASFAFDQPLSDEASGMLRKMGKMADP